VNPSPNTAANSGSGNQQNGSFDRSSAPQGSIPLSLWLVVLASIPYGIYVSILGFDKFLRAFTEGSLKEIMAATENFVWGLGGVALGALGVASAVLIWKRKWISVFAAWIFWGCVFVGAGCDLLARSFGINWFPAVADGGTTQPVVTSSLAKLLLPFLLSFLVMAALAIRKSTGFFGKGTLLDWGRASNPEYSVGTLRYTGFGLLMVFVWLLWGDFIFTLLDGNVPGILPVQLSNMGASDVTNAVLSKTVAYSVAFLLAPWVSTKSDRTRTRFGRRMPYLFWSTPFVGLFLVGIGLYEPLTKLITRGADEANIMGLTITASNLKIAVLGVMIVCWDFANIFVNTVYWYLFNDVVPSTHLSRFMSFFRIVGTAAGMAYNEWIFPHALSHFSTIFVVTGIAYAVGFLVMVIFLREGGYPPPEPMAPKTKNWIETSREAVRTYARECFCHKLYWYFYLTNTCKFMCFLAASTFGRIRDINVLQLSMSDLGRLGALTAFISLLLQYPAGWVADRWHPVRVYYISYVWNFLGVLTQVAWVFVDFNTWHPQGNLIYMMITSLVFMPMGAINDAAELPMYMRLLPRERYGQFCSANAMVRAFAMIFGSVMAGWFIGALKPFVGEWRYTWVAVWTIIWQIPGGLFLFLMYRQWKLLGGNKDYTPPMAKDVPLPPLYPVISLALGFVLGFAGIAGWLPAAWHLNVALPTVGALLMAFGIIRLIMWFPNRRLGLATAGDDQ
jgi:maltose/moltooligosaccharide transporter